MALGPRGTDLGHATGEPAGAPHEHKRHQHELDHRHRARSVERDPRERDPTGQRAGGLHQADQHRCREGAAQAAEPTGDHDHERVGDGAQVHRQRRAVARGGEAAAKPRERTAQREHRKQQRAGAHAQGRQHLRVRRRRAHAQPEARAREQRLERQPHGDRDDDQEQVVAGHERVADRDRRVEADRQGREPVLGAPDRPDRIADDQPDAEGGQQHRQRRAVEQRAHDACLHDRAEHGGDGDRRRQRAPEAGRAVDAHRDVARDPRAEQHERAVREVDDACDAEDQRQPGRAEEQRRRRRQAGHDLGGDLGGRHRAGRRFAASASGGSTAAPSR
ncbi:MAG: hypothetical protein MUF30_05995 [Burkholderiales bacterium]|nr:hypothetical protein [Burkholderiales bacterium]